MRVQPMRTQRNNQAPHLRAISLLLLLAAPLLATDVHETAILPVVPPWSGASQALQVDANDPWITPSEVSGLTATPRYEETVTWLERLVAAAPQLEMQSIGISPEGRDIWMIIASHEGAATPQQLQGNGRPTVLAHSGIHAGEIDGKDAGLMLLRDLTVGGRASSLLERVNLLFIPILSVDGHERFTPFGRINQRGPKGMGWRTNSRNLNLNRDYSKLETPELQSLVQVINRWDPLLYLDLHVTDGADYQYDITYGANGRHAWSPSINGWILDHLQPSVDEALRRQGHIPGPLILTANNRDLTEGFPEWTAGPRFSNGYGDARHLGTILVENHSLKPYDQRVLGTYVFMEAVLDVVGSKATSLREATQLDRDLRRSPLALSWRPPENEEPLLIDFLGIRSEIALSAVSGSPVVRWTGEPVDQKVPKIAMNQAAATASRPPSYLIPAGWQEIATKLIQHGIEAEKIEVPLTVTVQSTRLPEAMVDAASTPFEGRARVIPGELVVVTEERTFPAGSYRVTTDQPLGDLAMLLLEPNSPDSLFQWGYFLEVLQRTEYVEPYVMEPMAERMLEQDPELRAAFKAKLLSDQEFAHSPQARLRWFYEKTPFFDQQFRLYPVARELP